MIEIKEMLPSIFVIKEIYYKEHANIYLINGAKNSLLIDTGIGLVDIRPYLHIFKNILVVNTHCHFDHIGGNKYFKTIYIHKNEKNILKNPNKKDTALFAFNKNDILDRTVISNIVLKSPYEIKTLKNGDKINLGSFKFIIIHTPGHSEGSICLYEKKKKILFCGDTLYEGKLLYNLPNSNKIHYLKSLKCILKLDVDYVFPGHNDILKKDKFYNLTKSAIIKLKKELGE